MKLETRLAGSFHRVVAVLVAVAVVTTVAVVVGRPIGAQTQPPPRQESDFYSSDGEVVHVTVALDALGVLAREGFSTEEIQGLAQALGARVTSEYRGGLFIFGFDKPRERAELVKLAREIGRRELKYVTQAGLVLAVPRAEDPVIATDEFIARFKVGTEKDQIEQLNKENAVRTVMENPFVRYQYVLRVTEDSPLDVIRMAQRYDQNPLTEAAYPNFINVFTDMETSDPRRSQLHPEQPHLMQPAW